jgi:L-threonylcarbamoyladenylate synthase
MIYLRKNINDLTASDYKKILDCLKQGKVAILPTDTIYGLSCLASNKKAVKKIFSLKKRRKNKPFIILVGSLSMACRYAIINKDKKEKIKAIWQGRRPTTVIMPAKIGLLPNIVSPQGTISLRLPKSNFLIKIIKRLNAPLISTSLNISGRVPLISLKNLNQIFLKDKPSLVVDNGSCHRRRPSRILDLSQKEVKIIR